MNREVEFAWIEGAKLIAVNGMTGATGNVYCGLHEFADMGFLLHFLRKGDLFVDAGANIGSYTVLASAVCGADTIAFEPDPRTMAYLMKNIKANGLEANVKLFEAAVGSTAGEINFTVGFDTTNQVAQVWHQNTRKVKVIRLDDVLEEVSPSFIKLDVEGYEGEALAGARQSLRKPSLKVVETESRDPRVLSELHGAGFGQYAYDPFSRRLTREASGSSNALFLRDTDYVIARVEGAPYRSILNELL